MRQKWAFLSNYNMVSMKTGCCVAKKIRRLMLHVKEQQSEITFFYKQSVCKQLVLGWTIAK